MSSVKIQGSATGTAVFTVSVPDGTSTDRTIELPDSAGSFVLADASGDVTVSGAFTSQGIDDNATSTAMTLDSSGNLLVGTTDSTLFNNSGSGTGINLQNFGNIAVARDGNDCMVLNRLNSDGNILLIKKDGTGMGQIGSQEYTTGSRTLYIQGESCSGIRFDPERLIPFKNNSIIDNALDVGDPNFRWDDIYATNGTIQTSDANEKQQIASLTDAEINAAKAISKLFKTFKWNDKVAEKGDAARTHAGVIAQEVKQAMTDAGLDVGNYAFFISNTWWETQTEVPAVEADEENGIEAQEAYTRIDSYDTAEEAPEGATERTRLGIRYPELLSFVGAATEQRLASIESRLDALEAV